MKTKLGKIFLAAIVATVSVIQASAQPYMVPPLSVAPLSPATFGEILTFYKGSLSQLSSLTMDTYPINLCGNGGLGGMQLNFNGVENGVPITLKFWAETYTMEQMNTIYDGIKKNYPARGLPPCLLADKWYSTTYNDLDTDNWILFEPVNDTTTKLDCGSGSEGLLPLTSCIYANPLYPVEASFPLN